MYCFSLIDNFKSIIENGILSQSTVNKNRIKRADFSNQSVQYRRAYKNIKIDGIRYPPLHEFVPLYWVPRTPTLYAIATQGLQDSVFFVEINLEIFRAKEKIILFIDGNAASSDTSFFCDQKKAFNQIDSNILDSQYWNNYPDGKRKRNAEILVHKRIEPIYFNRIVVNNKVLFKYIVEILNSIHRKGLNDKFRVEVNNEFFF